MSNTWCEVEQANAEKRCELVLAGSTVSDRIKETGLDLNIFKIVNLNFLEISKTCLTELPNDIGNLVNLTRVVLCNNDLEKIPSSFGNLKKLKVLDVSFNSLKTLPEEVSELTELLSINVSNNRLSSLPDPTAFTKLVTVNIAHNEFTELPVNWCNQKLQKLSEIHANNNKINAIPVEIAHLSSLKALDLGNNSILVVPVQLGLCAKLKDLNLKGNKLQDNRLLKLVDQCPMKKILDYILKSNVSKDDSKQAKSKKKTKQSKKFAENEEIDQLADQIRVHRPTEETIKVVMTPNVQDIRPYMVCCVLLNINLTEDNALKKFIALQTKLHESICEKRTSGTIATHDLEKIDGNLVYDAKAPGGIKILPLGRKTEITAARLYEQLNEEADALRKEKKKNTYSGIHKYLYMLKDKPLFPCLSDNSGKTISFPPITNSEGTKINENTSRIFIEVSGSNLPHCKKIMDMLLQETLKLGIGEKDAVEENDDNVMNTLNVQQVWVVDEEGHKKVVYPSRTDIQIDGVNVTFSV